MHLSVVILIVSRSKTYIRASKIIISRWTGDLDIAGIDIRADLRAKLVSQSSTTGVTPHTSGLEQTMVPTTGSYLPEVIPLMFLKCTSEMVRLLCLSRAWSVHHAKNKVIMEGDIRGIHCRESGSSVRSTASPRSHSQRCQWSFHRRWCSSRLPTLLHLAGRSRVQMRRQAILWFEHRPRRH